MTRIELDPAPMPLVRHLEAMPVQFMQALDELTSTARSTHVQFHEASMSKWGSPIELQYEQKPRERIRFTLASDTASLYGRTIQLLDDVAETIAIAARGRRLSEVIHVAGTDFEMLADVVIEHMTGGEMATILLDVQMKAPGYPIINPVFKLAKDRSV